MIKPGWTNTKDSADGNGAPYTIWKADVDSASTELRHYVYSLLLESLPPDLKTLDDLRRRGLSDAQITERQYGYLGTATSRKTALAKLIEAGLEDVLSNIPGFFVQDGEIKLCGPAGILIPGRNSEGLIVSILIRRLDSGKNKYLYLSSANKGGRKASKLVHVPIHLSESSTVRVTEGVLKADVASSLGGLLAIGLPGLYGGEELKSVLSALGTKEVQLAFDADYRDNPNVAHALVRLYRQLQADFSVRIETWDAGDGKGIDDVLLAKARIDLKVGAQADEFIQSLETKFGPPRPIIIVDHQEQQVNDQALSALAADPEVYTRYGQIVWICPGEKCPSDVKRLPGLPQIKVLPEPIIREKLTACADWKVRSPDGDLTPEHPPAWSIKAIAQRQYYPGLRPLEGIATGPVLRADGSILMTKGYDVATGLYLCESYELNIPAQISSDDVKCAANKLLELVQDFPFASEAHRSTWIAQLLTLVARHAYDGFQPLFLFDANTPGSGKGLLLDLAVIIASGVSPSVMTVSENDEEMRKRITSLVLAGDTFVKLDNLDVALGGASLEAAVTSDRWRDRLLSTNQMVDAPLRIVWCATGNNVVLAGDMPRRVAVIRLVSPIEQPETRDDFRIKDIRAHCAENRRALLEAVLILLTGYIQAGRPDQKLRPWGSFEDWSSLVRATIVWAGLTDPADACESLTTSSRSDGEALSSFFDGLQILGSGQGLSSAEILRKILEATQSGDQEQIRAANMVRDAIGTLCPNTSGLPTAGTLGKRLSSFKERVVGGRSLISGKKNNSSVWMVKDVSTSNKGDEGDTGDVLNPENFQEQDETNELNISGLGNTPLIPLIPLIHFPISNEELF